LLTTPIYSQTKKGDTIPAKFFGKDGSELNSVPDEVQKSFNQEYGIKLGYSNGQLYETGCVPTSLKVSPDARKRWEDLLGKSNTTEH